MTKNEQVACEIANELARYKGVINMTSKWVACAIAEILDKNYPTDAIERLGEEGRL